MGDRVAISSMTGFARSNGEYKGLAWTWELRSVNGRGLDVRTRLPNGFSKVDQKLRAELGKHFARGNVSVNLVTSTPPGEAEYHINKDMLRKVIEAAQELQKAVPGMQPLTPDGLLALRGVIENSDHLIDDAAAEERNAALLKTFSEALNALDKSRAEEGARLVAALNTHLDEIEALVERLEVHAATQPDFLREKLKEQVNQILSDVSDLPEERLAQEVALLLVKADIREEIDRLKAHIASARELIAKGGVVGRRLDFLCQEFNRESNTICSKAADKEITHLGLDLKALVDKLREQVQNIE